ncbi:metalloregulator ArsR/SmtB family transcription factor [Roseinatronobacter sp. S2]|uniref:metalloregulator ArsR/SmtB family transcription factor n=1 Tax=Roseinatronobacter sp. S2 TaxID=3035471 RepID=UPI00240EEDFE|nr:metalloregulator ArsR/SmtB family transcription factor [Roseinatronobacter sp. S2]WFE74532.1 metalloregulator ArsR/SmtB family transcription factor [Roseinatronobacter sp. S2]
MESIRAAHVFAILGHPDRLSVFRLLMRFAPRGQRPTEIAQALGLKQNTLSHHLRDLVRSGLLQASRQGRSLYYAVDLDMAEALIGYLALDVGRARPDLLAPVLSARAELSTGGARAFSVLFVCSGNSARSVMAEVLLRDLGAGRFTAHSAGTRPAAHPNPAALDILRRNGHVPRGLRSKHIAEFQAPDAPKMDFVFTVCDASAAQDCPRWSGCPITGHWGLPDPVQASHANGDATAAFALTYAALRRRIAAFVALPVAALDRLALQTRIDAIDADALIIEKA